MEDINPQSEISIIDIGRFSEISKKVIVKHPMGCDNLVEGMKGISAFTRPIPRYRKPYFAKRSFKERRILELDFVFKWALEKRVLKGDNLFEVPGIINVHSAMVVDK